MSKRSINKYYAYLIPSTREKGIKNSWTDCKKKVEGVVGARYKGFATRGEAELWLDQGATYEVRSKHKKNLSKGVYFDAGTGFGKGVEISVTDEGGNNLLHQVIPAKGINHRGKHWVFAKGTTNNFGELLACKYALQIAKKHKIKHIFGDSKLVIDYWSSGKIKKDMAEATKELAYETAKLKRVFEKSGGVIGHIPGGDNPADLGFHR
ncbi:MAG: ribonuclease H family protein [Patescibacteria group bacterium]